MTDTSIAQSFIKSFEAEVHNAYQRMGSKLRATVRSRNNIVGASTVFQVIGKGSASQKSRHGDITAMGITHKPVEVTLADYYAGDWIDKLDELKVSHDEKTVVAQAGAYALGRKTDELIISALDSASGTLSITGSSSGLADSDGMTKAKVLAAFEKLGENDVPDDGERYAIVGWKQWSQLMAIQEFASTDYVGSDELPWNGTQAKRWLGSLWMPHSGLTKSGSIRKCYWYHRSAVAHAAGSDVQSDITWHGDKAAHFINNMMSQGAGAIDPKGIVQLKCTE